MVIFIFSIIDYRSGLCFGSNRNIMKVNAKNIYLRNKWTFEEDTALRIAVVRVGTNNGWDNVAKLVPERNARQCRERWNDYLSHILTHAEWEREEEEKLIKLQKEHGNRWVKIARLMGTNRRSIECKNHWHCLRRQSIKNLRNRMQEQWLFNNIPSLRPRLRPTVVLSVQGQNTSQWMPQVPVVQSGDMGGEEVAVPAMPLRSQMFFLPADQSTILRQQPMDLLPPLRTPISISPMLLRSTGQIEVVQVAPVMQSSTPLQMQAPNVLAQVN
jgi:hypothetical protein